MSFNTLNGIIKNGLCCGCSSCVNSCLKHIITLEEDASGFLNPVLTHPEICIDCNNCTKSCPIVSNQDTKNKFSESIPYHGHVNDIEILKSCSSGGLATVLSTLVIEKGGVVFGVRYSPDFTKAIYSKTDTLRGLEVFKGSKYIQPEIGASFLEVRRELESKRLVLFIGLPCIISGLKTFLSKEYDNLITCDLICFGVTSPKISAEYIQSLCRNYKSTLTNFSVRYKNEGNWLPPYIRAEFANNMVHLEHYYLSDYGWGFTQFSRPSCYQCFCKNKGSSADLTLGDAKGCRKNETVWAPYGISVIFVHTVKGDEYLNSINGVTINKTTYANACKGNPYLMISRKKSKNYSIFYEYLTTKNLQIACDKTYPLLIKMLKRLPLRIVNIVLENKLLLFIYKYKQQKEWGM